MIKIKNLYTLKDNKESSYSNILIVANTKTQALSLIPKNLGNKYFSLSLIGITELEIGVYDKLNLVNNNKGVK